MRVRAANGEPNAAAAATGRAAFLVLATCLLACWPVAANMVRDRRLALLARGFGTVAAGSVVVFAVVPFDTEPTVHAVATLAAGLSGLAAIVLLLGGELRHAPRLGSRHLWAGMLVVAGAINAILYVVCVVGDGDSALLPVVQKIGSLLLVLWMGATMLAARRSFAVSRSVDSRPPR